MKLHHLFTNCCLLLFSYNYLFSQGLQNLSLIEKDVEAFEHKQLGIIFFPTNSYFYHHLPADTKEWKQIKLDQLGISIKSPKCYNSDLPLDFGEGVTVELYESEKLFPEIAFEVGFEQYRENDESFSGDEWDTIRQPIIDSLWVMRGLSGVPYTANVIEGKKWRGLRSESDSRAYSKSSPYSWIADCWISLLVRQVSDKRSLVVVYRKWPANEDDTLSKPQLLDEQDFYDLVASIKWLKKTN